MPEAPEISTSTGWTVAIAAVRSEGVGCLSWTIARHRAARMPSLPAMALSKGVWVESGSEIWAIDAEMDATPIGGRRRREGRRRARAAEHRSIFR